MLSLLLFYKDAKAMKVEGVICCFVVNFFSIMTTKTNFLAALFAGYLLPLSIGLKTI
jgi:hypothetical protein